MPRWLRDAMLCAALAALAACAASAPKPDLPPLVWPDAPDAPRITFVQSISRPDDLGITKTFLEKLADWVFGASEQRMVRPMAVVTVNGALYVADPGVRGVHRFDPAAKRHDIVRGEGDAPLPSPVGLARGPGGDVYVTDSALASVLVIRPGAQAAVPLPLPALQQPTGIAFDAAQGRLYVVDTKAHHILVFGRDGALLATLGRRGTEPGEFNFPTHLWRDAAGRLYVTDSLNYRVQVLDAGGRFLRQFGRAGDAAGDFMRQKGLATDSYGHVYIVDALLHALQVFDANGALLLSLGDLGRDRGEFWLPAGLFIGEDDTIYIADSYNQRVQVLRYIGGPT